MPGRVISSQGGIFVYSKKVIKDISESLDARILQFVGDYENKYDFYEGYLLELVETIMNSSLGEWDESGYRSIVREERKKRKRNKVRWYNKLEEAMKQDEIGSKHPFYFMSVLHDVLPKSEWDMQYEGRTLKEVLQQKFEDAGVWLGDTSAPLVSYPAITSLSKTRILSALKSDMTISILDVIDEKYGGSIKNTWSSMPSAIIDVPFFSPRNTRPEFEMKEEGLFVYQFIFGKSKFVTEYDANDVFDIPTSAFTNFDMQIIGALFSKIDNSFWFEPEIRFDLRELVREIKPNAGEFYFVEIKERLKKYPKYTFSVQEIDNPLCTTTFNLFDSVTIDEESECSASVVVRPGHYLTNALLKEKTTRVYKKELETLKKPLSRLFAFKIQRERIRTHYRAASVTTGENGYRGVYPYSFFESAAKMPYKRKEENLQEIRECLEEMKKRQIFISDYQRCGSKFEIFFLPLSSEEEEDYRLSSGEDLVLI